MSNNNHDSNSSQGNSNTSKGVVRTIKDITSGIVGGVCQTLSGQPFDTVKIRLQTQSHLYPGGALQCLSSIIRNEGIFALYQGTLSPLISASICAGVQFSTNEATKRFFGTDQLHFGQLYLCGMAAGLANSPIVTPAELIRIRLQVQNKTNILKPGERRFTGSIDAFVRILKEDGIRALYRGHMLTMTRECFGFGFFFGVYDLMVRWQAGPNKNVRSLSTYQILLCGSSAGLAFWSSMYPVDVIKSKMQVNTHYKNVFDCISQTYKQDSFKGFYRGFTPCALRSIPVNAFVFLGFEVSMRLLG